MYKYHKCRYYVSIIKSFLTKNLMSTHIYILAVHLSNYIEHDLKGKCIHRVHERKCNPKEEIAHPLLCIGPI